MPRDFKLFFIDAHGDINEIEDQRDLNAIAHLIVKKKRARSFSSSDGEDSPVKSAKRSPFRIFIAESRQQIFREIIPMLIIDRFIIKITKH